MTQNLHALETLKRAILDELKQPYESFRYVATVAEDTGLPKDVTAAILRDMRDNGLVVYRRGLFTEDGEVAGSGYAITHVGTEHLKAEVPAGALVWTAVFHDSADVEAVGIGSVKLTAKGTSNSEILNRKEFV